MQEDEYRGDGLTLYAYCKNNPVVYYDPSGYNGKDTKCKNDAIEEPKTQDNTETYYRTMSKEDYDKLRMTGEVQATGETFISPTKSFSEDYDGVTVKIAVNKGTTK